MSTLNDVWSLDVMVYMHELGHNLGLGHAFLSDNSADYSSYMSATGPTPNLEGPRKCYNGASHREMGWYQNRTEVVDLINNPSQRLSLAAFSEADKAEQSDPILLEVGEYTLQYNFASGFNIGTEMLRNAVTVARSEPGITIVDKDGLVPNGNVFSADNFAGTGLTLKIEACTKTDGNAHSPNAMTVGITLGRTDSPCVATRDIPRVTTTPATVSEATAQATETFEAAIPVKAPPCPDTSNKQVMFRWGRGIISVQCKWIDEQTFRYENFCDAKVYGAGQGQYRGSDVCMQECAGHAKCERQD